MSRMFSNWCGCLELNGVTMDVWCFVMDFGLSLFVRMLVINCWYVVKTIIMIFHVVFEILLMLFVLYLVDKMAFKMLNVCRWMTVVN